MTYTVIVCGGHDTTDYDKVYRALSEVCDKQKLWKGGKYDPGDFNQAQLRVVITGERGAENAAIGWAACFVSPLELYGLDPKLGIRAAAVRNAEVFEKERINLVLAFGKETNASDLISRAFKLKIPVKEIK